MAVMIMSLLTVLIIRNGSKLVVNLVASLKVRLHCLMVLPHIGKDLV